MHSQPATNSWREFSCLNQRWLARQKVIDLPVQYNVGLPLTLFFVFRYTPLGVKERRTEAIGCVKSRLTADLY